MYHTLNSMFPTNLVTPLCGLFSYLCLLQLVSEGCHEDVQVRVLSLLHLATEHSVVAAVEFEQQGGMLLIQQVMRTPQAVVGEKIMKVRVFYLSDGICMYSLSKPQPYLK